MSETVRCYECGRRYPCATCGGYKRGEERPDGTYIIHCPDCEDGWRRARIVFSLIQPGRGTRPSRSVKRALVLGTDPNVLCSKCEKEKKR